MTFKSNSHLFMVFSTFSFLLTFCNVQNELPVPLNVRQLELTAIVDRLGFDSNEIARLYSAIVDGRIGEIVALLEEHADVNAKDIAIKPCESNEISALHSAVNDNDIDRLSMLLNDGADVNTKDKDGKTPLHLASELKHLAMIKLLLERSANINEQDNNGDTPLHKASYPYYASVHLAVGSVNLLIRAGADIEAKNKTKSTPLITAMAQAVRSGGAKAIPMAVAKTLIGSGANVNAKDDHGRTPLHFKVSEIEMVKMLIHKGADVNAKTNDGKTPLHVTNWVHIAKMLIENGADINAKTNDGCTALHITEYLDIAKMLVSMGANSNEKTKKTPLHCTRNTQIAKMLIDKGADINVKTDYGETPLLSTDRADIAKMLISMGATIPTINDAGSINAKDLIESYLSHDDMLVGILKIVRALVLKGAYVNKKDWYSETPIYTASKVDGEMGVELVKHLIKLGADINAKSETIASEEFEFTPLQAALYRGNMKTAKVLIENGATVNVEPSLGEYSDGNTVLSSAVLSGDIELVSLLLNKGADVNKKNTNGTTSLHVAVAFGHVEIMKILLEKGADVDAKDKKGITPLFLVLLTLITQEFNNAEDIIKLLKEHGANANPVTLRGETPQEYYEKYLRLPLFVQKNFYTCW